MEEIQTLLLYNQSSDPILIDTCDPALRRRPAENAEKYPDLCCWAGRFV